MTASKTASKLLANIPPGEYAHRSGGPNGNNRQHSPTMRDLAARGLSRVIGDSETELVFTQGSTDTTIAAYYVQNSAGAVMVAGTYKRWAAADDLDLLAGDITGYQLVIAEDGTITTQAPVALSADGQTYWIAIVEIVVNGAVEHRSIFGVQAADGAEEQLTDAQIAAALKSSTAAIANLETHMALVVARIKAQRAAGDVTLTSADPTTDDSLAAERSGCSNPLGVLAA